MKTGFNSKAHLFPAIDAMDGNGSLADGMVDTWKTYDGVKKTVKASINTALALKMIARMH